MYKLYKTTFGKDAAMKTNEDGSLTSFVFNPDNTDYQAYLKWVSEGGVPTPTDE
jgi:hypothetical protein